MRWYKRSIVFAIGLFIELIVATISCVFIKQNAAWIGSLRLPYFAPKAFPIYGIMMETIYLSTAASLALYAEHTGDLPKGVILISLEGAAEIVTLLFFFKFTYEITAFFSSTLTMILSTINTIVFLGKNDAAGIAKLPSLAVILYLWTVLYCILMINFT